LGPKGGGKYRNDPIDMEDMEDMDDRHGNYQTNPDHRYGWSWIWKIPPYVDEFPRTAAFDIILKHNVSTAFHSHTSRNV